MRRLLVVLAALAAGAVAGPQFVGARAGTAQAQGIVTQGCLKAVTRSQYGAAVRREYREPYITRAEQFELGRMRGCAVSYAAREWMDAYGERTLHRLAKHRWVARLSLQCADKPTWRVIACIRMAGIVHGVPFGLMKGLASCESGFDPKNVNGSSGASGVFQFLLSTWRATPTGRKYGDRARFSARHNSMAAAALLSEGGRHHWVC